MKVISTLLTMILCTTHVQSEQLMFIDKEGKWVNSQGGNIYGDSRYNLNADPRYNLNADPRYNLQADPRYNLNADPRFNIKADPDFNVNYILRY